VAVWQDGGVKRNSSELSRPRRHRTPKEIAALLQEHRRSGLSLLAFARQRQLCYASLLRWRSRPRTRAPHALVVPDPGGGPRFVPVQIQSEALTGDYVLGWPGGRSLRIPPRFETDSLRRLLEVLEGLR
jgi:hypothetical protein